MTNAAVDIGQQESKELDGKVTGLDVLLSDSESKDLVEKTGIPEFMMNMKLFRVLGVMGSVAKLESEILGELYYNQEINDRTREIMILRLAYKTESIYVIGQHKWVCDNVFDQDANLADEVSKELVSETYFNALERTVITFVDQFLINGEPNESTMMDLAKGFGSKRTAVKMFFMVLHWHKMCLFTKHLDLEEDSL